jgi:hypothetical protein
LAIERRELYRASNDDRWYLARDTETGYVFVQHQGNRPSGGHIDDMEFGRFLDGPPDAPERRAFMRTMSALFTYQAEIEPIAQRDSIPLDELNSSNDE